MYFFGYLPQTNENMKKTLKSHFLGKIFLFIQIAYIILVKEGFVWNVVTTPKNVEKHVIYIFFSEKSILWQYSAFFVYSLMKSMK